MTKKDLLTVIKVKTAAEVRNSVKGLKEKVEETS